MSTHLCCKKRKGSMLGWFRTEVAIDDGPVPGPMEGSLDTAAKPGVGAGHPPVTIGSFKPS